MKKIISLFKRDLEYGKRIVYDEIVEGAEWVAAGEGVATIKTDGTSCLVKDGKLYKRYDAKHGKKPPPNFEPAQDPDPVTGHWPGWLPVGDGPEDQWHRDIWDRLIPHGMIAAGTYELVGPKIQGNPYGLDSHQLVKHSTAWQGETPPRTFEALKAFLAGFAEEGIVWHHPDGRMVKIKRKDFGLPWPVK